MMLRVLLLLVLAGLGLAQASDKIDAPSEGASKAVTQPHVVAELIPEMTTVEAGKPFGVILHLHMDPSWHTYWINPGDAGIPTTIKWTLPPGFTAGPIQWPTPEQHNMGPLVTYGYEGDAYLLTTITPPATGDLPEHLDIKAKASWLVCQEACIPGKAEFSLTLDSGMLNFRLPATNTELFKEARERLPVENTLWRVSGQYNGDALELHFFTRISAGVLTQGAYFFPEQANVLNPSEGQPPIGFNDTTWKLPLQQNGEKPTKISGVFVANSKIISVNSSSVYIAEFPVANVPGAGPAANSQGRTESVPPGQGAAGAAASGATLNSGAGATEPAAGTAAATLAPTPDANATSNGNAGAERTGGSPSLQGSENETASATTAQPLLIAVLGAAFIGGLILNLMPCVLPVLSLKVFALIRHAGEHPEKAWRQGAAFTAGVVISFWILAGLLLALRAAGNQLGWGFQMQSPGFVAGLIVLFFLIGLNLFGVFEVGGSLVGLDAKAASHTGGGVSSFLNGALATVAATPCTAPFMGSALGFAAQQSTFVSLLIFTFLALGMAAPYMLLTLFPQSLKFVPKPGAWMESLKQFMGFLLMGTVIFLLYVYEALIGSYEPGTLGALLVVGMGAWIYGRWGNQNQSRAVRVLAVILSLAFVLGPLFSLATPSDYQPQRFSKVQESDDGWQNWSPDAVQAALAKGEPVFVDFTAAWCLSCKVNERVALGTDAVKSAFAEKRVALFRADWTRQDPVISQTLQKFNRDGVPLYLLYSPKAPDAPQVLPEVLTPGIVLEALGKI